MFRSFWNLRDESAAVTPWLAVFIKCGHGCYTKIHLCTRIPDLSIEGGYICKHGHFSCNKWIGLPVTEFSLIVLDRLFSVAFLPVSYHSNPFTLFGVFIFNSPFSTYPMPLSAFFSQLGAPK